MNQTQTKHDAGMRLDIQALRAIAIVTVVVFHIWNFILPGGYVGVDIFFVISGYLITGQLWREVTKTGKIAFANFWARRARRLLPASLLAIFVTTIACVIWVPSTLYLKFSQDATGAAFYVQNWVLANRATDYLANDGTESAFQHFWSLSVEEQYYVFWPVLMGLALLIGHFVIRRKLPGIKAMVIALLALLTIGSFAYSIWATANTRELAYFSTFTRAWEFAGGALLSVLARPDRTKAQNRNPAWFYAGLALVVYALASFTTYTPFPSFWAAFPVVGAMLMLYGGESQRRFMPLPAFRFKPVKFLGDISYSLYLWHWPVIIVAPWVIRRPLNWLDGFVVLALSLLLAWASKRFVEDPVRFGRLSRMRPAGQLVLSSFGMVAILALAFVSTNIATENQKNTWAEKNLTPALSKVAKDLPGLERTDCRVDTESTDFVTCEKGNSKGQFKVALIGDSHARQYYGPLLAIAKKYDWSFTVISKSACPIQSLDLFPNGMSYASCPGWNKHLNTYLANRAKPFDLVFTSSSSLVTGGYPLSGRSFTTAVEKNLTSKGTQVLVIKDSPKPMLTYVACIEAFGAEAAKGCSVSREAGLTPKDYPAEQTAAVIAGGAKNLKLVDLTSIYCPKDVCSPVIGRTVVYRDHSHITNTWAMKLQQPIEAAVPAKFKKISAAAKQALASANACTPKHPICQKYYQWAQQNLTPNMDVLAQDQPTIDRGLDCHGDERSHDLITCEQGDPNGTIRVALLGDSHARQYFTPINALALKYHWKLTVVSKSACTLQDVSKFKAYGPYPRPCGLWNEAVDQYLKQVEPFDLAFVAGTSRIAGFVPYSGDSVVSLIKRDLLARGTKVIVVADSPRSTDGTTECIAKTGPAATTACSRTRSAALNPPDRFALAASKVSKIQVADLTDAFCSKVCPAVIDGKIVYRDASHISDTFAATLEPKLDALIPEEFKK